MVSSYFSFIQFSAYIEYLLGEGKGGETAWFLKKVVASKQVSHSV